MGVVAVGVGVCGGGVPARLGARTAAAMSVSMACIVRMLASKASKRWRLPGIASMGAPVKERREERMGVSAGTRLERPPRESRRLWRRRPVRMDAAVDMEPSDKCESEDSELSEDVTWPANTKRG